MLSILHFVKEQEEKGYDPILILDIDDTVLSTTNPRQKYVDKNVLLLVDYIYNLSPLHLWFLTARSDQYHKLTLNQFNRPTKLLHRGKYIHYNIVHSPYDEQNRPTKGKSLVSLIEKIEHICVSSRPKFYIFVDDDEEQLQNVKEQSILFPHLCFHFVASFAIPYN
jgi:hypothetical protein